MEDTSAIQACIERLRSGDATARDALINCACERLRQLTRRIKRDYSRVARWEETDDVLHNAVMRLSRALESVELNDVEHFLRLATRHIRFELIDLARKHYGPLGIGAHHQSADLLPDEQNPTPLEPAGEGTRGDELIWWGEFHERVGQLPPGEREVFEFIWYQGMKQHEVAALLGIGREAVKRRWRNARLRMHDIVGGDRRS